ncbi:MAG: hypothetical protein ACRDQB_14690 [Thermocrispum sp.]
MSSARQNLRLAMENGLARVMKDLQKSSPQMRYALEMNRRAAQRAEHQHPAAAGAAPTG